VKYKSNAYTVTSEQYADIVTNPLTYLPT